MTYPLNDGADGGAEIRAMGKRFTSLLAGGADVLAPTSETLLGALIREPGSAVEAERAIARKLADGSLRLAGSFRGREREILEGLTDGS